MDEASPIGTTRIAGPAYHRFFNMVLAACLLLAPLMLAAWFGLCPQYGNPQCPTSADPLAGVGAFRTANSTLTGVFLTLGVIAPYIYPLSYIGLGIVALDRSWKLATAGMLLGWLGSVPWGAIGLAMFIYNDLAQLGNDTAALTLLTDMYRHWQIFFIVAAGWVIGHQLAYVLLGIALWRVRAIPKWASFLLIVSGPLMGPIAYGTGNGWLQVTGYVLVFVASVPAALALVKGA